MLPFLSLFSFPVHSKDYPTQELTFDLPDMEPKCTINYQMPEFLPSGDVSPLLESPRLPMEFLSRSWSAPALEITKALAPQKPPLPSCMTPPNGTHSHTTSIPVPEEITSHSPLEEFSKNQFSFASSATSQLVLERIMSQSTREEMSSLTSGRLSHNSVPLIGGGSLTGIDSPPISPEAEFDDLVKFFRANYSIHLLFNGSGGRGSGAIRNSCTGQKGKTVGRWLKERREKKKEENRIHNAQLHATISVASVAAAVAAITAATAASSTTNKDKKMAKIDVAVASAATLVAAQCVGAAEAMGAERDHLASVVGSAVNVRSHDDITTLTAAAATALRGATTLKARGLKEVWNISSMTPPQEKGMGRGIKMCGKFNKSTTHSGEIVNGENFPYAYSEELLARGFELLKRTRNGDLHWKIVSAHIHHTGQVILKMKSKHVAGTITKKKKNVVVDVCGDLAAWPGRNLVDDNGEIRRYFGLKTESRGIVEFECRNQTEYDIWTQGVSKLLSIGAQRKNKCANSTS